MRKSKLIALILCSMAINFALPALAEEQVKKNIWSCNKEYRVEKVLWLVEWGSKSYIKVFDDRIPAIYDLDGLTKRWSFGLNEATNKYEFAVILSPDQKAYYYNFKTSTDGTAKSSDSYICKK